jgi:hypothetical protein
MYSTLLPLLLIGRYCSAQGPGPPPCHRPLPGFPLPGAAAARRVHFAPQQPAELPGKPFSPGPPPGVFARPADVLDHAAARPARNCRAPTRLDL